MEYTPGYEESHLLVAAIRVLAHRDGRSPTPEDVASLLQMSNEKIYILVHELRQRGILRVLESPFELRLDVSDPAPLEALPRGASAPSIEGELAEFYSREQQKKAEMERMFRGGEADKRRKERVAKLEEQFLRFKPKPGAAAGLFKGPGDASEGGDGEPEDADGPEPPPDRGRRTKSAGRSEPPRNRRQGPGGSHRDRGA